MALQAASLVPFLVVPLATSSAGAGSVLSGNALSILLGQNTITGPTTLSAQIGAGASDSPEQPRPARTVCTPVSNKGGVSGDLKAAGSAAGLAGGIVSNVSKLLGAASPLLSAIPIVGSIASLALPLIGSLFGNNPQKRQNDITNELAQNQYLAPTALNVTQSSNGTLADFDARGLLRTSTLSALPNVTEPYISLRQRLNGSPYRTYSDVPGQITGYGSAGGGTGQTPVSNAPSMVVNVSAIDVQSFHDFLQKPANTMAVGESLASHLQTHEGRASNAIRFITGS